MSFELRIRSEDVSWLESDPTSTTRLFVWDVFLRSVSFSTETCTAVPGTVNGEISCRPSRKLRMRLTVNQSESEWRFQQEHAAPGVLPHQLRMSHNHSWWCFNHSWCVIVFISVIHLFKSRSRGPSSMFQSVKCDIGSRCCFKKKRKIRKQVLVQDAKK